MKRYMNICALIALNMKKKTLAGGVGGLGGCGVVKDEKCGPERQSSRTQSIADSGSSKDAGDDLESQSILMP